MEKLLSDRLSVCVALAKAVEGTEVENNLHIERVQKGLTSYSDQHCKFQRCLQVCAIVLCSVAAVSCLVVLVFDWLEAWGHWLCLLLMPLPLYLAIELINYCSFVNRSRSKVDRFAKFRREFEVGEDDPFHL